jgi:hypothetical protein
MKRQKEALADLETAMEKAPRLIRKILNIEPSLIKIPQVADMIARYRRKK